MQIFRKPAAGYVEPIDLTELKEYLRITHRQEDRLLTRLIASSREACENAARISIVRKNCTVILDPARRDGDDFGLTSTLIDPDGARAGALLPYGPVISITSVKLKLPDGVERTATPGSDYVEDLDFRRLAWVDPDTFHRRSTSSIRIGYVAGYPDDEVPAPIIDAILEAAASSYTTRADLLSSLPTRSMQLLAPYAGSINMAG